MESFVSPFLVNGRLVFTVTTNGYKFLTWNLWLHCQKLQVPWKLCIICLDKDCYRFFKTIANIPCILFPSTAATVQGLSTKVAQHGTGDFYRITRQKLIAVHSIFQMKDIQQVLYLDGDIVLFRDPWPVLETYLSKENPLWFQCDEHNPEFACANPSSGCRNACTGVIACDLTNDSGRHSILTVFALNEQLYKDCHENNDQEYIQKQLTTFQMPFSTLPRPLFPNGLFLRDDAWKSLSEPVLLHFNFLVGTAKERVLKAKGFWLVPY